MDVEIMLAATMGDLYSIQLKKNASVLIVVVYALNCHYPTRWDDMRLLEWCRERLPAQHDQAHIMAYEYEDLSPQASPIRGVNEAAKNLLSKLAEPKTAKFISLDSDISRNEDTSALDPTLPVLFVCRGFAGLVVKKALVLARLQSGPHTMSQRVAGIIFLETPHNDAVQVWVDRLKMMRDPRHGSNRDLRMVETTKHAEDFVDLTKDFQKISSQYNIIYICNEDWLECSGATVLHSNCLWSVVSQEYLRGIIKENHYVLPRSTTSILFMAHLERAAVGMRKLVASREPYRKCLESQRITQSVYAGERLPSTCDWFFASSEYLEWKFAYGPACLWITGVAGTGKTILSSAIVDDLLACQRQGDVTVYFFFEVGFGRDDFAQQIIETLFRQLLDHHALPHFMLYKDLPDFKAVDPPMSRETFQRLLRRILEHIDCGSRIVLVLDGVDKDEWIKHVVTDEVNRINISRHRSDLTRCLISSRDSGDNYAYRGPFRNLSLDSEVGVQRDVLRFAESRLENIQPADANANVDLTSIGKKICSQGRGNFLWVALVTESLQDAKSFAEVEDEVQALPSTIDGLYQRALQKIPSREVEPLQRLFAFLIAAHRPFGLSELTEALATRNDSRAPPSIGRLAKRAWSTQWSEAEIRRMCSPLIITLREDTIRFRHSSVRRYLLSTGETNTWKFSMVEAHTLLAQTCLMFLSPEEAEKSPFGGLRRYDLRSQKRGWELSIKDYASSNWSFHYGLAESHSKTLAGMLHHTLTLALNHDCEELSLPEMSRPYQIETTILRIAAYHGFVSLTRTCLEMGVNRDGSCNFCETPLALAATGCHSRAATLLIQRGASKTAVVPSRGETALHLAAAYGSREIAEMLLKDNAKAGSDTDYLSRTPLHAAASAGHLEVLKLLMDYGVDGGVNLVIPTSGETPLHLAASRGHLHTVKLLLEGFDASDQEIIIYDSIVQQRSYQAWTEDLLTNPASTREFFWGKEAKRYADTSLNELQSLCARYGEINTRTREGRTALHLATLNGHVSTVRFLLQKGANVNVTDNNQWTPLRLAAENGHLGAVELLLTAGAELNEDFDQLGATLKSITANGHDTVANLLAWHFFSVKIMGMPSQWPVLDLATKSKQNTVRDAIRKHNPHDRSTA